MARVPIRSCRVIHYDDTIVSALQALERGQADANQQQRALKWIVEQAGRRDSEGFFLDGAEGGERASAFMAGRRFVSLEILKLISLTGTAREALRKAAKKEGSTDD